MKLLSDLKRDRLIHPPEFLPDNTHYMVITGSVAYGVSQDMSDMDLAGFCVPPKDIIFPHTAGIIEGFGPQGRKFESWQQHHVAYNEKMYDLTVYSIVHYFQLALDNNPNMVDTLYVADNLVLHCTALGRHVRDNRKLFLHKGAYHKFMGYAYSQLKKATSKEPIGRRREMVERYGFDVKFASHLIRLADEAEQILSIGDLDLTRSKGVQKDIRAGNYTLDQVEAMFRERVPHIERLYAAETSPVPHQKKTDAVKELLFQCLEMHYGSLDKVIVREDNTQRLISEIDSVLAKYR